MSRRLGAALAVGLVPWTVLFFRGDGGVELIFAWGLFNTETLHPVSIYAYLFEFTMGLPNRLLAWPTSVLLYAVGLGGVGVGVATDREDRRFTAGTFAFAGIGVLLFTLGIARRNPTVVAALPAGALALWALAWWSRPA